MDQDFLDRAKSHWTPARESKLTGGANWPIRPSMAPALLRTLGLLNRDASMPADSVRKFSQINHMVSLLLPQLEDLRRRHGTIRVLDACCGTSYLTLLLAWLLKEQWQVPCRIVGVDSNADVIKTSTKRAEDLGLGDVVRFAAARVDDLDWERTYAELFPGEVSTGEEVAAPSPEARTKSLRPHLLVALHACDVATDFALALGVRLKCDQIAVAPCCQGELARKWKDLGTLAHPFGVIFRSPNLRRETAAQMTDAMRMLLLRANGYEVTATEFVPSAHTPKNRLLTGVRRGNFLKTAVEQYEELKAALANQGIKLEELLREVCS